MASNAAPIGLPPQAQSTFTDGQAADDTLLNVARAPKIAHSTIDPNRRHSLPHHFLPPNLWSANTSSASLVETEEAARGEHVLDEATVAHRISALRQLNGSTKGMSRRYAKSTGARNSTFNQPVIVRTYSGAARPRSQRREPMAATKMNRWSGSSTGMTELKLPPVEAFSFKGIMDEIKHGVAEDLERIAEICARSRYSLSNQYEVHMPPHGRGEQYLQTIGVGTGLPANVVGPTLQAIGSDDEHSTRSIGKGSRGGKRARSAAYGTLETIMSSSRSSDEEKSKKKPAAALAEEVRGRAAKKGLEVPESAAEEAVEGDLISARPSKHVRSRSATFASIIIDSAQGFRHDAGPLTSPASLISEPARPQTSIATNLGKATGFEQAMFSPTLQALMSQKPTIIRNESSASSLVPDQRRRPSVVESISSWIPWRRLNSSMQAVPRTRLRSTSHAEANLRGLLEAAGNEGMKGKGRVNNSVVTH
ncbi:hypothetical protein BP6252_00274 [Coleophoma cylindrospora]|uniref:Uncharacterized protein n=1 Tax=Coleophoma cylindrospora TaxID=1849047 RepID=A0A3D8SPM0_9HELO|nr:hypothetical protein BP6252_00274 [Coleophoma cylindrospora]